MGKTSEAQLKATKKYRKKYKDRNNYMSYRNKAFAIISPTTPHQKNLVNAADDYRGDLLRLKVAINDRLKNFKED